MTYVHAEGYVVIKTQVGQWRLEHIAVVERVLGKRLRRTAQVHHINENRADNRPENLVACDSLAYHKLLHYRTRALRESGHPDWWRCQFCGIWDDPITMVRFGSKARYGRSSLAHRRCYNDDQTRRYYQKKKSVER